MMSDWIDWHWDNIARASSGGDLCEIIKSQRDTAMTRDQLQPTMADVIDGIRLFDTHEHIVDERVRMAEVLDFTYFMPHYLSSDLVSAGMPLDELEAIRAPGRAMRDGLRRGIYPRDPGYPFPERLPDRQPTLLEKWRRFAPFWARVRNTGYARCILTAIRDLFGIGDLNEKTVEAISAALQDSNKKGWYHYVLKERARIDLSVLDCGHTDVDRSLFAPSVRFDRFVDIRDLIDVQRLEYETDTSIHSLGDLVKTLEVDMARKVQDGMVAVKTGLAYQRIIRYDDVTHHDAERAFNRLFRDTVQRLSWEEAKPFQDYMMHQVIRQALEHRRPIQVHTGLQEGNGNVITNSRPTHLVNLFIRYPDARFDLFHAGYPYHHELATLAKNFPNVYADLCWAPIISPTLAAQILHEWLETIPVSKILAFGGDFIIVEGAYGHATMVRQIVSRVLSDKVRSGLYSEEEAATFGRMILRENAQELFGL